MSVTVAFLNGQSFDIPVADEDTVRELSHKVKHVQPPFMLTHSLLAVVAESEVLPLDAPVGPLVGSTLTASYVCSERSYFIMDAGRLVLLNEGDERWSAADADKWSDSIGFCAPAYWVPPPDGREKLRNLVKPSEGVTVTSSSNIFNDEQKLQNIIRLGSKHGEPRCVVVGDSSFIFSGGDADPTIVLDFGREVSLLRVGAIGPPRDRWINFFEVSSTLEPDPATHSWETWGTERRGYRDGMAGGPFFVDSPSAIPIRARLVRMKVCSGHVNGARVGNLFAYGWDAES
eukprot:TRINITY_DN35063_c0_g1_i1.p1 TRINITY_DN35063_c0_g1~~TRINITY_DN35063_c0_g1_i1.p1  ORF type:complete len:288 (-),score=33.98 TRINITY_DN35063_c0_g1_i1:69-932(-)